MDKRQQRIKAAEEASYWLLRLEHEHSPQIHAEFDQWIRQGALNVEEFLHAKANWTELDALDSSFNLEELLGRKADVYVFPSSSGEKAATGRSAASSGRRPGRQVTLSIAMAAAALMAVAISHFLAGAHSYSTAIGAQQTLRMSDGSVIYLNTDSKVRVNYSASLREIRLIQGEALFTAAPDANRPFFVLTDDASIRALGTQFNVRRERAATRVAVMDGLVQVASDAPPIRLAAGDEAEVRRDRIVKSNAPNVQRAVAWRARRLIFERARIDEIAGEFNRYNPVPIRIEDDAIAARRMGGTYEADDAAPWLRFLSTHLDAEIVKSDEYILVRARR